MLAVDDDPGGLFALRQLLTTHGFEVITASSGAETLARAAAERPDLVLLDVMMPPPDGYEVTRILKRDPELRYIPVILLTGRDELADIVYGLDQGADDYVGKPFNSAELLARLHAALRVRALYTELRQARQTNRELAARVEEHFPFESIIGRSQPMAELFRMMSKVVDTDVPVLITGASGTGKEVVATALHLHGPRREKALVVQNCSAFNDNLLESELFGHVRGAFTGALRDKQGLFEAADGGTFFLDELGEMSPALQVKLLRVLQDGTFLPVGGTKPKRVDVRIIAATNRDIEEMVQQGTFREDLYYRLNVVNLRLPPLRERSGDVPLLVQAILKKIALKSKSPVKQVSAAALEALERYQWPGNIRQLENELQRAVLMAGVEGSISVECLSPAVVAAGAAGPVSAGGVEVATCGGIGAGGEVRRLKDVLEEVERNLIDAALARCNGNKSEAARQLGISRSNLLAKAPKE